MATETGEDSVSEKIQCPILVTETKSKVHTAQSLPEVPTFQCQGNGDAAYVQ